MPPNETRAVKPNLFWGAQELGELGGPSRPTKARNRLFFTIRRPFEDKEVGGE